MGVVPQLCHFLHQSLARGSNDTAVLCGFMYSCESWGAAESAAPLIELEEDMMRYDELYDAVYSDNVE